jgi:exo-beta-1,3-glucanase (GH17 family)
MTAAFEILDEPRTRLTLLDCDSLVSGFVRSLASEIVENVRDSSRIEPVRRRRTQDRRKAAMNGRTNIPSLRAVKVPMFQFGRHGFRILVVLLGVVTGVMNVASCNAQSPARKTYGVDFSPYLTGQDPNLGPQIPASQILDRMQIVAPFTNWVRTYSSTHGLENSASIARQLGLKVAAGAWISGDATQNALEITNLIAAANAGLIDVAIVGSEAILRNDVTPSQLIAYMNEVRQVIPGTIPVTTADVWGTFIAHPELIAASDIVFANFFPYWERTSIANAMCSLRQEYQQLMNASGSKTVWISETGWPSAGNTQGAAIPSTANAHMFALQFLSWANSNGIHSFYFEAFDEAWKANYEGPQGAHWGIFDTFVSGRSLNSSRKSEFSDSGHPLTGPCQEAIAFFSQPFKCRVQVEAQSRGHAPSCRL